MSPTNKELQAAQRRYLLLQTRPRIGYTLGKGVSFSISSLLNGLVHPSVGVGQAFGFLQDLLSGARDGADTATCVFEAAEIEKMQKRLKNWPIEQMTPEELADLLPQSIFEKMGRRQKEPSPA